MARQGKTLVTKPDEPGSIPGIRMVEGEDRLPWVFP